MAAAVAEEMAGVKGDPYDTHPSTAERLRTIGQGEGPRIDFTEPSAADLLGDVASVEGALLRRMLGPESSASLKELRWEDSAEVITVRRWKKAVSLGVLMLNGHIVRDLPDLVRPLGSDPFGSPAKVDRMRAWALGAAFGMALHRAGWGIRTSETGVTLTGPGLTIDPYEEVANLASGDVPAAEEWRRRIEVLQIATLPLHDGPPLPAAPEPPEHRALSEARVPESSSVDVTMISPDRAGTSPPSGPAVRVPRSLLPRRR
jgi:hypothetical protein